MIGLANKDLLEHVLDALIDLNELQIRGSGTVQDISGQMESTLSLLEPLRNLFQVSGKQYLSWLSSKK